MSTQDKLKDLIARLSLIRDGIESGDINVNDVRAKVDFALKMSDMWLSSQDIFTVSVILCNMADSDAIENIEAMLDDPKRLTCINSEIGTEIRRLEHVMGGILLLKKMLLLNPRHTEFNSWDRPGSTHGRSRFICIKMTLVNYTVTFRFTADSITQYVSSTDHKIGNIWEYLNSLDHRNVLSIVKIEEDD